MRTLLLCLASFGLVACVDTTGLTAALHSDFHPDTAQSALVTVTEYADLQCPACRSAHTTLITPIIAKYGKQISYDYRHFPLSSIHPYAMIAAEASECAIDAGSPAKFWEFVDYDYTHQQELSAAAVHDWAKALGLDADIFDRCIDSHIKRKAIQASYDEGISHGVGGTPTIYVNGTQVTATFEDLSKAIDAALNQASVLR